MKRFSAWVTAIVVTGVVHAEIIPLVRTGDSVAGVGDITSIDNLAVNNAGDWLVESDTNNPDGNVDGVMLRSGVLYIREGDPIEPAGASVDSFDSVNLNNSGGSGWNFFLSGTGGTNNDSGIYYKTTLVLQESTFSTSPVFGPNTPYIGFFDAKINDANQIMLVASIDDPNIPTTVDRAMVILNLDSNGELVSETVVAKEGDILPGQVDSVADFGTAPHLSAINHNGDILYLADLNGDAAVDGTIWLNTTLLAQEGSPSPVAGRNYELLSSRAMDLNSAGDYVFKANLDGDTTNDEMIVRNAAEFVREGGSIPAIAPFTFENFGTTTSGPVRLDEAGDVLWFGDWNDPDTNVDSGLFLNQTLLVQEGVSQVEGVIIDTIQSGEDAFSISDNGRYVIFEAVLADGRSGAFLLDLGAACDPCDTNCDGSVNGQDISGFVDALNGNPSGCSPCNSDADGNGTVNGQDIDDFVACLGG